MGGYIYRLIEIGWLFHNAVHIHFMLSKEHEGGPQILPYGISYNFRL